MNKLVREGKVAILYSPGFGAGWYTWNLTIPELMFDPGVVDLVENRKKEELIAYVNLKWPDAYFGGIDKLQIMWLPEGTQFRVTEYDGNENVETKDGQDWFIA